MKEFAPIPPKRMWEKGTKDGHPIVYAGVYDQKAQVQMKLERDLETQEWTVEQTLKPEGITRVINYSPVGHPGYEYQVTTPDQKMHVKQIERGQSPVTTSMEWSSHGVVIARYTRGNFDKVAYTHGPSVTLLRERTGLAHESDDELFGRLIQVYSFKGEHLLDEENRRRAELTKSRQPDNVSIERLQDLISRRIHACVALGYGYAFPVERRELTGALTTAIASYLPKEFEQMDAATQTDWVRRCTTIWSHNVLDDYYDGIDIASQHMISYELKDDQIFMNISNHSADTKEGNFVKDEKVQPGREIVFDGVSYIFDQEVGGSFSLAVEPLGFPEKGQVAMFSRETPVDDISAVISDRKRRGWEKVLELTDLPFLV